MSMRSGSSESTGSEARPRTNGFRLLVVAAEAIEGKEVRDAVVERARSGGGGEGGATVRVLAPALTKSRFEHAAGAVDRALEAADERLARSLAELREAGVEARGQLGDSDLRLAIQDALQTFPADEIVIVAHRDDPPPLEPQGIEEAEQSFEPPITELYVSHDRDTARVAEVERSAAGVEREDPREHEARSRNLPPFSPLDLAGILVALIGTGVLIVLAANCGGDETLNTRGGFGDESGGFGSCEVRALIAGGMALVNIAHVVGLVLFQAGPYRGVWRRFFSVLSLYGTAAAIVVSVLIG
jgi:hypothetical protein